MYVGPVYIPAVHNLDPDTQKKNFEQIKAINASVPIIAEFMPDARTYTAEGTLYQENGTVKTPEQYAEDVVSLLQYTSAYNYVSFQNRQGFITVGDASAPLEADRPNLRTCNLSGLYLPKNRYQPQFHTAPAVLSNPFSFVLGTNDVDNYVAVPIGATYTGGDGSTITRTSEDGTITLVLATTLNDIYFDLAGNDVDNGECKCWDEMSEASEADWIRVFNADRQFAGDVVIQNGLYRVQCDPVTEYITVSYWSGAVYTKIDDFTAGTFASTFITKLNPDTITLELDSGVSIELRRGHPPRIDTGTVDLLAVVLTPADQSTGAENYLILGTNMYICSDAAFSIVNATKNLDSGKKWIYFETVAATAEDIAHQAMVNQNLARTLTLR